MMDAMVRLGDGAVGYAALMVLLVAMAVVALMRLIAVLKMLKQVHTHGEHAGFKYEEMHH
jgi:hypothetical protein